MYANLYAVNISFMFNLVGHLYLKFILLLKQEIEELSYNAIVVHASLFTSLITNSTSSNQPGYNMDHLNTPSGFIPVICK